MKRNDHKPYQKEVTPPQKEVSEKIEYHSTVDEAALENKLEEDANEFMRKLELGRVIKKIMIRRKIMKVSLSEGYKEALELFEKHEQVKDVKHLKEH